MFPHNKKCLRCRGLKACRDEATAWLIIAIGIIATIAVRIVTVLMAIGPIYGKVAWYVGVVGFLIFFFYKYRMFDARAKLIDSKNLIERINRKDTLSDSDLEIISVILCNTRSSAERINFFFIFASSFVALIIALYFDFFR